MKHADRRVRVCRRKQPGHVTCQVERRGVAALRVSAVDVLWRAELLHSGQAALLGSIQQGGVAPQQVLDVRVSVFDHVQRNVAVSVLLGRVGSVLNRPITTILIILIILLITDRKLMNGGGSHLEQQLADLILALRRSLVKRREFPQIGHVDRRSVSDQQLRHLVVTVGAGVVEGDQTAAGAETPVRVM